MIDRHQESLRKEKRTFLEAVSLRSLMGKVL